MLTVNEETQAEIAVDRLRLDILAGKLAPGQKLRVAELKALYGIGASPLREALSRVVSLGYVTSESRRGYRVAGMSRADLADITHARQTIEIGMLRESMEARQDEWQLGVIGALDRLRLVVRKIEPVGALRGEAIGLSHKRLHAAIVAGSTSPRLVAMQDLLFDQAFRYRELMISEVHDAAEFLQKHEFLVEAVLGSDIDKAIRHLSEHLFVTLIDVYGMPT